MSGYLVYLAAENTLFPVAFSIILYQWALKFLDTEFQPVVTYAM